MAKSYAQKKREKLVREGRRDPRLERGSWRGMNPIEKRTPTIVELQHKLNSKHKKKRYQPNPWDDTFFIFAINNLHWSKGIDCSRRSQKNTLDINMYFFGIIKRNIK